MNKRTITKWMVLTAIIFAAVAINYVYAPFSLYGGWPSSLSSHFSETGLFRINPRTILASLNNGTMDVFFPDSRSVDNRVSGPILFPDFKLWSQSDNLKIAGALNKFVWKDEMDGWSLFTMTFSTECQDNPSGLPGGIFKYFRTTFEKGKMAYTWREIEINAEYAYVAWGGGAEFAHPILGLKSIDLSNIKVMAEDALRIAEENGGSEARQRVNNRCEIYLFLMPERYEGWRVNYGYSSGFEIEIDPYTGEVIK